MTMSRNVWTCSITVETSVLGYRCKHGALGGEKRVFIFDSSTHPHSGVLHHILCVLTLYLIFQIYSQRYATLDL